MHTKDGAYDVKKDLFSRHSLTLGLASAVTCLALGSATAQAALIDTTACDSSSLTQPFQQYGDGSQYKLASGGDFEDGAAGWTLGGGAHTVSGSEPFGATGSVGSSSLELAAGQSAQSPLTCVNAAYPTFRFFARNEGLLSTVDVSVVYKIPLLGNLAVPGGAVALSNSWKPSLPMLTASIVDGALHNGTAQVALRFTALTGRTQIDDVFVDPRMSH